MLDQINIPRRLEVGPAASDFRSNLHSHLLSSVYIMADTAPTQDKSESAPSVQPQAEGGAAAPAPVEEGASAGPTKGELKRRAKEAEKAKKAAEREAREAEEKKKREAQDAMDEAKQNYGKLPMHQSTERNGESIFRGEAGERKGEGGEGVGRCRGREDWERKGEGGERRGSQGGRKERGRGDEAEERPGEKDTRLHSSGSRVRIWSTDHPLPRFLHPHCSIPLDLR